MYNQDTLDRIVEEVTRQVLELQNKDDLIEVEASARHVHLSQETLEELFGKGSSLTFVSELSQPNQFLSKERVALKTEKNTIERVAILGPVRKDSQVELSLADARALGIKPPLRNSGDIQGSPGITLCANGKEVTIDNGVIVAARHIHMTCADAKKFNVEDNEKVSVQIDGERSLVFNDVLIRVSDKFSTRMHIDFDEANACGFIAKKTYAKILK